MDPAPASPEPPGAAHPVRPATRRRLTPAGRPARAALVAIVLAGLASFVMLQNWSDNQSSHYDLIRALDAGRTTIDAGPYQTKDKAFYKGHYYSARAPGLAIYALPFYDALKVVEAQRVARSSPALRGEDEIIDFIGWWGNVLPAVLMMLLVWRLAERFEPGYGGAAAVAVGLGTLVLPFSTLLFSHVFAAMLGFAAFALMVRERAGPPRPLLLGAAGLLVGYAIASEYPVAFVAVVLGLYLLSRRDAMTPRGISLRAGAYILGAIVGIVPLLLYNHAAFHSWTHLAYSNIPQQQRGFFGISAPSLRVLGTLLFDSRGLLTLSPVLILGGVGTWLLYRRGRRAEALTIAGVCLCYLVYNSGYYLPFGGGAPGPRFMITMLPFLACPLGLALRRFPGPTITLAAASITTMVIATITHPLIGYENETVVWTRLLSKGEFQPTIATALGLGELHVGVGGWASIWPFLLAVGGAVVALAAATPRLRLPARALGAGALALAAWAAFAALAPTVLGIDHRGLIDIKGAGDTTALNLGLHHGVRYPLTHLVLYASLAGALGLAAMWATRRGGEGRAAPDTAHGAPGGVPLAPAGAQAE
ncbi:MAG: hypothetical protein JWM60_740 [Solirubrobacterales bacterium]|nr:hypothetical protein [Solirubrobacterales bacterium]